MNVAGALTVTLGAINDSATLIGTLTAGNSIQVAGSGFVTTTFTPVTSITIIGSSAAGQSVTLTSTGTNAIIMTGAAGISITGTATVTLSTSTTLQAPTFSESGATTAVNLSGGLSATAPGGTINVTAGATSGNISVSGPLSAGGSVTLTAQSGAINEPAASGTITTGELTTASGRGTTLTGRNTVATLSATNTTNGDIALTNAAPSLTITGINQAGGGNVTVNNTGGLTVSGAVSAGGAGAINLAAGGANSDLLVNANVSSGSGAITATAGRDLTVNNSSISTPGGAIALGTGRTATLNGAPLASATANLTGSAPTNTLVLNYAAPAVATWTVTGPNSGNVTAANGSMVFIPNLGLSAIGNLTGGAERDIFTLRGTTPGTRTLTGSIVGGSNGTNILNGDNVNTTFTLTGPNTGTVTGVGGTFSNIQNLNGGNQNDTFVFQPGGRVAGSIDGGAGQDTLDFSTLGNTNVNVALNGVGGIDGFTGTATSGIGGFFTNIDVMRNTSSPANVLTGANLPNLWRITGTNSGILTSTSNGAHFNLTFSGFPNLAGGPNKDSFVLQGGTLTGAIDGSGGFNTLTGDNVPTMWVINQLNGGTVTGVGGGFRNIQSLIGGTNTDIFTLAPAGRLDGSIDGGAGPGLNTLIGPIVESSWSITGLNTGTVVGRLGAGFRNIQNLTGGTTGNNSFVFANDSAAVQGTINGGGATIAAGGGNVLNYESNARNLNINLSASPRDAAALAGGPSNVLPANSATGTGSVLNFQFVLTGQGNNVVFGNDGLETHLVGFRAFEFLQATDGINTGGRTTGDTFIGLSGHDRLLGGSGPVTLVGSAPSGHLSQDSAGQNFIYAGPGGATKALIGGNGDDAFILDSCVPIRPASGSGGTITTRQVLQAQRAFSQGARDILNTLLFTPSGSSITPVARDFVNVIDVIAPGASCVDFFPASDRTDNANPPAPPFAQLGASNLSNGDSLPYAPSETPRQSVFSGSSQDANLVALTVSGTRVTITEGGVRFDEFAGQRKLVAFTEGANPRIEPGLPGRKDTLSGVDLASSLLLGGRPVANLLPQKGRSIAPVATITTTDAGEANAVPRHSSTSDDSFRMDFVIGLDDTIHGKRVATFDGGASIPEGGETLEEGLAVIDQLFQQAAPGVGSRLFTCDEDYEGGSFWNIAIGKSPAQGRWGECDVASALNTMLFTIGISQVFWDEWPSNAGPTSENKTVKR